MAAVYLALGSNVGDPAANISRAIDLLGKALHDIRRASIYTTRAVGYVDQPDFLNTAICGQTNLTPEALLVRIKDIEKQIGRIERFHWGPREIDIDIIFYDNEILESEELVIPHSAFRGRDFVLQPLVDLNPDLVDPASHKTVRQLLEELKPEARSITSRQA